MNSSMRNDFRGIESLCLYSLSIGEKLIIFNLSDNCVDLGHAVRIVVLWKQQRDAEPRKMLITTRTYWEVHRILKTYRKRWTGTETFHRDGKQHLGMGACQLRSGES